MLSQGRSPLFFCCVQSPQIIPTELQRESELIVIVLGGKKNRIFPSKQSVSAATIRRTIEGGHCASLNMCKSAKQWRHSAAFTSYITVSATQLQLLAIQARMSVRKQARQGSCLRFRREWCAKFRKILYLLTKANHAIVVLDDKFFCDYFASSKPPLHLKAFTSHSPSTSTVQQQHSHNKNSRQQLFFKTKKSIK